MIDVIEKTAVTILEQTPVIVVRYRLLRDALRKASNCPELQRVKDNLQSGMRLLLASTLSLIYPDHPALNDDRELWHEIARRTFQSVKYSEQDEINAHVELIGATVKDSYLVLNNRYQLNILGSIPGMLLEELDIALQQLPL
jgi:hypothetical protein